MICRHRKPSAENAFTLAESLTAFLIASILAMLMGTICGAVLRGLQKPSSFQLEMAVLQLRDLCLSSKDVSVVNDCLCTETFDGIKEWKQDRNRLVGTPGYEILLEGIDHVWFEQEQNRIDIIIEDDGKTTRWQIA